MTAHRTPNQPLQATPGLASLFFPTQRPGAPELLRWAAQSVPQ
jgi:hypothetical protein